MAGPRDMNSPGGKKKKKPAPKLHKDPYLFLLVFEVYVAEKIGCL
uniref:Uncharacterized protein n=1 Tax=Anguilla anguilla TaxID=7936 RepID=A0A0E9V6I4_ANGAN